MADIIWSAKFKGTSYEVTTRDLTVTRLRQLKSWFGADYGAYLPLIMLLKQGDIDALTAVLWIAQGKAGEKVTEPRSMDFNLDDFEAIEIPDEADEADPTPAEEATPTPDSNATASTSSEDSTSSTSPTSAD
ncbi:MAG: hypothetical protein NVS3B1_23570 [Marmoricola sp.]